MLLLVGTASAWAQGAASSPTSAGSTAVQGCERAVRETLQAGRGAAVEASFGSAPVKQPGMSEGDEVTLRGDGRYRRGNAAWQAFGYSCTVNPRTGNVAGIVLRDAAPAAVGATRATAPRANAARAEPDLALVSPEACESAAANALLRRWPQATRMTFNADSRQLESDAADQTVLSGQGQAVPTPGAPATHFGYRCTFDARSGRVVAARITD
jgi:hypothetical protein